MEAPSGAKAAGEGDAMGEDDRNGGGARMGWKRWGAAAVAAWGLFWAGMAFGEGGVFPLTSGARWHYEGTAQWTEEGAEEPKVAPLSWDMEALEVFSSSGSTVAVMRGMISETSGYTPGQEPGYAVLVERKNKVELFPQADELEARTLAKSLAENPSTGADGDLLVVLPLAKDKSWGSDEPRDDTMYQWYVEEERSDGPSIPGTSPSGKAFVVVYRTNPDTTTMELVPGVGITRWSYEHHGTVSAVDLALTSFVGGK